MRRRISLLVNLLFVLLTMVVGAVMPAPMPLAAQDCSDEAELIEQTLDPDTDAFAPDSAFTVAWTLRNTGDCAWSRTYRLIFVDGERMEGARTVRVRSPVEEAESVTFSLELLAPSEEGSYSGTWQLRNTDGDNFGPELTVTIEVGEGEATTTEVVLPEVMAFGGMGGPGDEDALATCVVDGVLPAAPIMYVDYEALQYRYTVFYLCSLPEGEEVLVEITDPLGNIFSRTFVEDAPVVGIDDAGVEYFGTVLTVNLSWITQAPNGEWWVVVSSESLAEEFSLEVQEVAPSEFDTEGFPELDNWPTGPIDPFAGSGGCHYNYSPQQEMTIAGENLPPNAALQLGFYQGRAGNAYLIKQIAVESDEEGRFTYTHLAYDEPGQYHLVAVLELSEQGFLDDETQYMFGSEGAATGCYSVELEEEPEFPLRLAYALDWNELGESEVRALDLLTGWEYSLSESYGCDASEPAWWPDGEWVVYQTTCRRVDRGGYYESVPADDYDLYASRIDPTYELPEEEKRTQLTVTPDVDETEPDVNLEGLIVYRKTAVGEALDSSGELWLLDLFNGTDESLGLYGRAPTWSPDGTRITFMSDIEGSWQIYVYDLEEDELLLVSANCETHCQMPGWSPNGRQIIYERSVALDDLSSAGLWIASAAGSGRPRLYLEGAYSHPTWSADGWIAFAGPGGLFRATSGRNPVPQRYLYSDAEVGTLGLPVWSH